MSPGRHTRSAGFLALCLLLAGCATAPSSFYALSSTLPRDRGVAASSAEGGETGPAIGIGPVRFPEFLDRPQIVSRTSANRLIIDEFHRWGGSLQDEFLRVMGENLGQLLGTSRVLVEPAEARFPLDFRVVADVLRFEGTPGGEALLKVRWGILDPFGERALAVGEASYRHQAARPDQEAMVAALSEALSAFSRELAKEIRNLPRGVPSPEGRIGRGSR